MKRSTMSDWDVGAVERCFSDAAINPDLWDSAMDVIAAKTGSTGALLLPLQGVKLPGVPSSQSMLRAREPYFRDGWSARDERIRGLDVMMRRGVAVDFDFISFEDMKKHPYYQEFLQPHNLLHFAGVRMSAGDDHWCIAIQRSPQQGPFSSNEINKLRILSQKLSSVAALARAIGFAATTAAVEALELSGSAVGLLNRNGEVLRLNRAAESLLCLELRVVNRRLESWDRNATANLDRALYSLLWMETEAALMPPVLLPRRTQRPILAYAMKLSTMSASILSDCQALIIFIDLESRPRPPQETLSSIFGLTPAEARLAIRVGSGDSLETSADELGISKETARYQLKIIFQKTGVHRQSEFVALLASFLRLGSRIRT